MKTTPTATSLESTLQLYTAVLAVLSLLALTACAPPKQVVMPTPKVTVSQPRVATVTNWDEYPAHLEAVEMVEIRPRASGYIDSIHFQDGAEVKAGDLLFVIDPRPYQADLDVATARRKQAETRLELTQSDLKRAERLKGTKAISEEELDTRYNAVREAEAAVAAAKATEATARLNLDYTQVKAPISGKLGRRLLTAGNFVQLQGNGGSATTLATLVSLDPIYAYFDVEEAVYHKYQEVMKGAPAVACEVPCELALVNEQGFPHKGHLDFSDNQVNPQTGTLRLRAVFDNRDRALVPGMFGNLRVLSGKPAQAMLVPDVAVQSDQGYKFVYIVNSDNKIETRSIEAGRAHGPQREVLKGLKPDDRVVVNGLMMLRPGVRVEAQESQPEGQPTRTAAEGNPKPAAKPQT